MKFVSAVLAFSIPALFAQTSPLTPPAPPQSSAAPATTDPNKVVMTVGGIKITANQYDDIIGSLPAQAQANIRAMGKRAFGERIAELMVLTQEAEKHKLDQDPKVREQIDFQRENLLAQAMYEYLQKNLKIDDAAVEKYFNEHKSEYEVVKARHILIRVKTSPAQGIPGKPGLTDEEALAKAQAIRKRLIAGEDFATLARTESDDTGNLAQGGDLGEFRRGMVLPPVEEAAFAAKIGEFSEPVKSPYGYHILQVQSHTTKTIAEARADIEQKIRPELASQEVTELRKGVNVQLDDAYFGPPPPVSILPAPAGVGGK